MDTFDATIIGAGVSGLTCARHLLSRGFRIRLLEGRSRSGGRLLTEATRSSPPHPPELGAEFIHGAPPQLLELLAEKKVSFTDVVEGHLFLKDHRLVEKEHFWEQLETLTNQLNPKLKTDRSVEEFLKVHGKKVSSDLRRIFQAYVEGFQAADLEVMGERALAVNEQAEEKNLNGVGLFRPVGGYGPLFDRVFHQDPGLKQSIRFRCVAKEIHWSPGKATVRYLSAGKEKSLFSRSVVITVPVGVMKAPKSKAGLQLFPEIQELTKGLGTLAMGHVQRLTLQFKTRFWEGLSEKPISFLHAGPEHFFPTWWTQVPVRSPFLIAWQGGPRAQFLSAQSKEYRLEEALKTLAKITGKRKTSLREQLLNSFSHDWTQDPFSLGAYSYTGVQSQNNLARLRKPFSKTILLAGEATAESTAQGTVHGAMESGLRAAKQLEALLNG